MYELRWVRRTDKGPNLLTKMYQVLQYRIKRADPVYGVDIWTDWKDVPTVDEN